MNKVKKPRDAGNAEDWTYLKERKGRRKWGKRSVIQDVCINTQIQESFKLIGNVTFLWRRYPASVGRFVCEHFSQHFHAPMGTLFFPYLYLLIQQNMYICTKSVELRLQPLNPLCLSGVPGGSVHGQPRPRLRARQQTIRGWTGKLTGYQLTGELWIVM